jgi:high-affinity nickel permease
MESIGSYFGLGFSTMVVVLVRCIQLG